MSEAAAPVLRLQGLNAGYGNLTILRDCTLDVRAGEVIAVIGANGAGKSTLLRTISGLTTVQAGDVKVAGLSVLRMKVEEIAALGVAHVPEGRRIFKGLSVRENLLLGGYVRRVSDIDDELLRTLAPILLDRLRQRADTLSGGQQQLLAICRAMMMQPRLLLLDEPSQGLSPVAVNDVCAAIKTIAARGTSVLLAEQSAAMVLGSVHAAVMMNRGMFVRRLLADEDLRSALRGLLVE
ncbi:MAG: ABC transporter ATP-binding protein [Lautropia sp.]